MWIAACCLWWSQAIVAFRFLGSTALGQDPQTANRLNGESFQQDPLVTFNGESAPKSTNDYILTLQGYQYAVFWTADATNMSVRHASVSRRNLKTASVWETFTLPDYNQTDDDGHDVSVN